MTELTEDLLDAEQALLRAIEGAKTGTEEQLTALAKAVTLVRLALAPEVEKGHLLPDARFGRTYLAFCLDPSKYQKQDGSPRKHQPKPSDVIAIELGLGRARQAAATRS